MHCKHLWLYIAIIAGLISCKKDKEPPVVPPTENTTIISVHFPPTAPYTFFNFKSNTVIPNTDSASTKWDFGLRLTSFIVNSNASGPGNAAVILKDGIFDNVTEAPSQGYAYDTASNKLAVKDGSWYDYNPATRTFVPKAGKVFIFRTVDNKYAKMEILEATYENFVGLTPLKIKYKIRFSYQTDGSLNLRK
ncbi:MAG: HmuY family protein [Chitinophagaceae bacterium]